LNYLIFSRVPAHACAILKNLDKSQSWIFTDVRFKSGYLENGFSNVLAFENYIESAEVLKTAIEVVFKNNIFRIYVMDESDVERAAIVREVCNIPGQKNDSAILYRDKYLMKLVLKGTSDLPAFSSVNSKSELKAFIETHGLPIVFKPRKAWATNNTYKITHISQIEEIEEFTNYIAEEWIDNAKMITVDGIQKNGNILWFCIHEYDKNLLESLEEDKDGYAMMTSSLVSDIEMNSRVREYTNSIISKLNNNSNFISPFHLEIFYTNDNKLVFCEVGSRFGGGKTIDLINIGYSVHLPTLFLQLDTKDTANIPIPTNKPKKYAACYKKFSLQGSDKEAIAILKSEDWIQSYIENSPKDNKTRPTNINDFEELYILEADSYEQCLNRVNFIENI
jgi:biotin carboxylase